MPRGRPKGSKNKKNKVDISDSAVGDSAVGDAGIEEVDSVCDIGVNVGIDAENIHPSLAILQGQRKNVARNEEEQDAIDDIIQYFKDHLDGGGDVEPYSKNKRIPVILEENIKTPADELEMTQQFKVGDTSKKLVIDQSFTGVDPDSKYNVGGNNKNGIGELDPSTVVKTNSNEALQIKPGTTDEDGNELDEVMMYLLISKNVNQKDICGNDIFFYYHPRNLFTPNFHHPGTGPEQCNNCLVHGSFGCQQRIWLGYCLDCAFNTYRLTRGLGFVNGVEVTYDLWRDKFKEQIGDFHIRISDLFRYGMSNQGKIYKFIMKFDNFVDFSDDLPEPKQKNFGGLSMKKGSSASGSASGGVGADKEQNYNDVDVGGRDSDNSSVGSSGGSHGGGSPGRGSSGMQGKVGTGFKTNTKNKRKGLMENRVKPPQDYTFNEDEENITYLKNIKKYRDVNNEMNLISGGGNGNGNGIVNGNGSGSHSHSNTTISNFQQNKKLEPEKIELVNQLLKNINYSDLPNLQIIQDENGIGLSTQILGSVKTTINGKEVNDDNKYSNMTPMEYNEMFENSFGKESSRGKISDNPNANVNIFNNFIEAHRQSVMDFRNKENGNNSYSMNDNGENNEIYVNDNEISGDDFNMIKVSQNEVLFNENNKENVVVKAGSVGSKHNNDKLTLSRNFDMTDREGDWVENGDEVDEDEEVDEDAGDEEDVEVKETKPKKYMPELEGTYDFSALTKKKYNIINNLVLSDDIIGLREYVDNGEFQLYCIFKQREKYLEKQKMEDVNVCE